jgi:hypothetical protein
MSGSGIRSPFPRSHQHGKGLRTGDRDGTNTGSAAAVNRLTQHRHHELLAYFAAVKSFQHMCGMLVSLASKAMGREIARGWGSSELPDAYAE